MRYGSILAVAALALLVAFGGLGQAQVVKLSDDAKTAAKGNNVFALNLYAQLAKEDGNVFFSPYSISSALAMTYAGAKGKTADEMASTLHFSLPQDKLHPAYGELVGYYNAKGAKRPYQLSVANALWGQNGFNFQPEFLKITDKDYGAKLTNLDFVGDSEGARETINKWVEKETNDKIKDLIAKGVLNSDTRLVLTNAIYFKSAWMNKFWKESTKDEDFTVNAGTKVKAKMMHKNEKLQYMKGDNFSIVSIPYEQHALSMIILLPNKDAKLVDLEKELTTANMDKCLKELKQHQVDLKLPQFKFTSQFMLSKTLSAMGMQTAFTPGAADFSGMSTQGKLFLQQVIHKAFVDVHEEGTEAAAATAVVVGVTSLPPPLPPATFHADRPFVFAIQDNATNNILFMGRVSNPQS